MQTEFILLPQFLATRNKYAYPLRPLANVNWSALLECFLPTIRVHNDEIVLMEGSKLKVGA